MEEILASLHQALGYRWKKLHGHNSANLFNPALCATNTALTPVIRGLKHRRLGQICLHGPAGTGKSALAAHLAKAMNKPLLLQQTGAFQADSLTRQPLADAVGEAMAQGGILLIDNACALPVGQLERVIENVRPPSLVLLVTTREEQLNADIARHFDIRIGFDYFTTEQAWIYFNTVLGQQCPAAFQEQSVGHLYPDFARLPRLTPGDFAAVQRNHHAMGERLTPERLLAGLAKTEDLDRHNAPVEHQCPPQANTNSPTFIATQIHYHDRSLDGPPA